MSKQINSTVRIDNTRLRERIQKLIPRIQEYRDRGRSIGEQDTKTKLIGPVLEALGWNIRGDDVEQEYKARPRDNPVDYALKMSGVPILFVEAKALGQKLSDPKIIGQVLGYATVAHVEWCVLTNGDEYHLFNASAPVHAEEKLFCKTQVSEGKIEETVSMLSLFSYANMRENVIETMWKAYFVDRQVRTALLDMVNSADDSLIKLVRKKVPALKSKEIGDSIVRMGIRIDPPTPDFPPPPEPPGTGGLADLVASGILKVPAPLFSKYKGQTFEATLLSNGEVEFRGQKYTTVSAAGQAVRQAITGRKMGTNGWTFWRVTGVDGKTRTLGQVRDTHRRKKP